MQSTRYEFVDGPMRTIPVGRHHSVRESYDEVPTERELEILDAVAFEVLAGVERTSIELDDESISYQQIDPTYAGQEDLRSHSHVSPHEQQARDRLEPGVAVGRSKVELAVSPRRHESADRLHTLHR